MLNEYDLATQTPAELRNKANDYERKAAEAYRLSDHGSIYEYANKAYQLRLKAHICAAVALGLEANDLTTAENMPNDLYTA